MQPIQDVLSRIRWDPAYARSEFRVGYYDREEQRIIQVPFRALQFDPDDHFAFQVLDENGEAHQIPFHRVKQLYRDGELIWQREH